MMLFALAALIHGSMLFGRALLEHAVDMTGPADETVKAAVDGKPVYSYVPGRSHLYARHAQTSAFPLNC